MPNLGRWTAATVGVMLGLASPTAGWAASPFDGSWTISQSCPSAGDVQGYDWVYAATVRNGMLTSSRSNPGGIGWIVLRGKIAPDGGAMLNASGRTGPSEFSVGHVGQGQPVHYRVQAHFEATSGTGSRVEQRPCDFSFSRS